jgi:predicted nucleic acid-binding protein
MIVVDASIVLELLLRTDAAGSIADRILRPKTTLFCPFLLDVEVVQVLRRYAIAGELSTERGREALDDLAALPLVRYPHEPFLRRVWELRHNVTAYDAIYLALAEALALPLITCDAKLASSAGHEAEIELVENG